jgi:hypothetical protein
MLRKRKAFLIWLAAMALFVATASAVSKCHRAASATPPAAGGGPAPPLPAPIEASPWRLVP